MIKYLKALVLLAVAAMSLSAQAQSGTVSVSGNVTSASCTASASTTITLPQVSTASLASTGSTSGSTAWTISLTACTGSPTVMRTYFEPGGNVNSSGRLTKSGGTSANVEVQVINADGTVVNMAGAAGGQNVSTASIVTNAASQTFYLRYYAAGTVTAGTYTSSFNWTVVYS